MNELLGSRPRVADRMLGAIAAFAMLHCSSGNGENGASGMSDAGAPTVENDAGGVAPSTAQSHIDLAYATVSQAEKLDLYLPARSNPAPLVIWIHGGGFKSGDKNMEGPTIQPTMSLLGAGYAVASLNYRLSGEAKYPAAVQDVKAAVRWLRANATQYRLNPDRFVAWGDSAGGYLVAVLGVTGDQQTLFDDDALGNAGVSSAVQAVVDWFGQTDFLTIDAQYQKEGVCGTTALTYDPADSIASVWFGAAIQTIPDRVNAASPLRYIATAKVIPPFAIAHGDADCAVPVDQSRELNDALTKAGVPVRLTVLQGAKHEDPIFYSTQFVADMAFVGAALGMQRE